MLRYLLEKEFKQIRRDRFMPKIIFIIPIMQLIILPFAANFEMRNINLSIVDNDHSVTSMQLVDKVLSSGYFRLTDRSDRYDEALTSVESNESDIILEIPSDFERDLGKEGRADVMIAANAVNGTRAAWVAPTSPRLYRISIGRKVSPLWDREGEWLRFTCSIPT